MKGEKPGAEEVPRMVRRRAKPCPKCGSPDVVAILYGYPTPEAMAEAVKGTIELGGCCVEGDDPRKLCKGCGEEFDRPPKRRTGPLTWPPA